MSATEQFGHSSVSPHWRQNTTVAKPRRFSRTIACSPFSILSVDLSALKASVKGRKITLSGAALKLTAAAAGALNQAFATTAFTEGLLLGTATVQATAE